MSIWITESFLKYETTACYRSQWTDIHPIPKTGDHQNEPITNAIVQD